jgi:predicted dehydrogenase
MRFGFAGVAHPHAGGWTNAVTQTDNELVAVHDPVRERAEAHVEKFGGEVVDRLEDLTNYNLDAVIVDPRCDEMLPLAMGVLKLNLPLLIDKPGGMNADELAQIDAEATKRGLPTQVGYFLRYAQPVLDAKTAIDSGALGDVTLVRCHAAMPNVAWEAGRMGQWFGDPTNITSIFQEDACHVVDILVYLLGVPQEVVALRIQGNFEPSPGEDAIATVWSYGNRIAVFGTKGTLKFGLAPAWSETYTAATGWEVGGDERDMGPSDGFARNFSTQPVYNIGMQQFLDAIAGGPPASANTSEGLKVFRVVEAIAKAADTKCAVKVEL